MLQQEIIMNYYENKSLQETFGYSPKSTNQPHQETINRQNK
jgi:hypothetical protein